MKRTLLALSLAAALTSTSASALMLQLSIGQGGVISPKTLPQRDTFSASPLTTEILVGYNLTPWLTLDGAFLFAYDVINPYTQGAFATSYYVGFRPGIHAYLGTPPVGLRPYFRLALPIQYDNAAGTTGVGLLLGGGFEYKLGLLGIFLEAIVSPYFNYENLIPIEGRVGVALHF
jgi:hypothetical protein